MVEQVESLVVTPSPRLSLAVRLDRLASFLPAFEAPGFIFAVPNRRVDQDPGDFMAPSCELTPVAADFVAATYATRWILPDFDWSEWKETPEAIALRDDPETLGQATAVQLARLLTVLIRQDRFVDGSLADAYDCGLLTAVVRRAAALRRKLQ